MAGERGKNRVFSLPQCVCACVCAYVYGWTIELNNECMDERMDCQIYSLMHSSFRMHNNHDIHEIFTIGYSHAMLMLVCYIYHWCCCGCIRIRIWWHDVMAMAVCKYLLLMWCTNATETSGFVLSAMSACCVVMLSLVILIWFVHILICIYGGI